MPKFYPEALLYCILWVALALYGLDRLGWVAALALSAGLFVIVMPASMIILTRTENFAIERGVRWGILAVAAIALFSIADLGAG
jgi:hypothetical protein